MSGCRIFISYSHDSDRHRQFVREVSDQLRRDGLECTIDQYINGSPPEGWQRWMEKQIELADFVLIICTPTYLQRFKGADHLAGRGVTFEGSIVSQIMYDNFQKNTKFLPIIPKFGSLDNVPLMLKAGTVYELHKDYELLYRVLTNQPAVDVPTVGRRKTLTHIDIARRNVETVYVDRLPTVKGEFFGRKKDLALLSSLWSRGQNRIVQFIAPAGTGKTKLIRHWLDHTSGIKTLIAWSFYSQGSTADKQVSAVPFFRYAFKVLDSNEEQFSTEEDKGAHLAELLRKQHNFVLVLDGLEPLQYASKGMQGELKDRALRQLLRSLAGNNNGLCIVTTRIAVHELSDRNHVISRNLENLDLTDGLQLLKSLGVHGGKADQPEVDQLEDAVKEYGYHALSLSLLGSLIYTFLDGNILFRYKLEDPISHDIRESRHAFKVMQAYEKWLQGSTELRILFLLGLFDHPIEQQVVQVLRNARIANLTDDITDFEWKRAIIALRDDHHLLSVNRENPDFLDCHPLIREYFSRQFRENSPDIWQQSQETLYEYYKNYPKKEFPDTLAEMRPLYASVAHGCAANKFNEVADLYWTRICRKEEGYSVKKLGAFNEDLSAIAHFYDSPWNKLSVHLSEESKGSILNWTGFYLRALGRLNEALEPMEEVTRLRIRAGNWKSAAVNGGNLSELLLALGDINRALTVASESVEYANKSGDDFWRLTNFTIYADTLHQAGKIEDAEKFFRDAEELQKQRPVAHPFLYSLRGFQYGNYLLTQRKERLVLERAKVTLDWTIQRGNLLMDVALFQLLLGRAHLQSATCISDHVIDNKDRDEHLSAAQEWIEQAVTGLRKYGSAQRLPFGLLTRAALFRTMCNFKGAHHDLQEVFEISERSGMLLHLADYHLESARLAKTEKKLSELINHLQVATKLITSTGYNRRLLELDALESNRMS